MKRFCIFAAFAALALTVCQPSEAAIFGRRSNQSHHHKQQVRVQQVVAVPVYAAQPVVAAQIVTAQAYSSSTAVAVPAAVAVPVTAVPACNQFFVK